MTDFSRGDRSPDNPISRNSAQLLHLTDFSSRGSRHIFAELRSYWESLRRGRSVPARMDVEPRGINRALDHAFILERIAPGAGRFRLAGRHLVDLAGTEVRGMPLAALLNAESRGRMSDVLESVFKAPQIAELELSARSEGGSGPLSARLLLLPLRSDLGDVTRALGCLIATGEIGSAARRFNIVADKVLPVVPGGRTVAPSASARGFTPLQPPASATGRASASNPLRRRRSAVAPQSQPDEPDQNLSGAVTPEARRAMFRVISTDGRSGR